MKQYDAMTKEQRGAIKDGPAFVGGFIRGGRRKKQNIESRSLFTLDADNIKDLDDFLFSVELVLGGSAYVVYSTHSHRPESPRCRVVVLPDRALTPDEHSSASRKLCEQIGIRFFDKKSFECQRLMYLPSCSADAELFFQVYEGAPVSVDGILAEYADWQDVSQWPRHPNEKSATLLSGKKAQDPTSKHGVIGLFCRAFSIDDGIEAFLSDQYSEGSMPNRYTYLHGTSANGLEVFPDQGLCYSHQDSDPLADGHTHNLFDAIRIHKFGHLDERVKEFTPAAKRPSHLAMEHFAIGLPEVKRLAAAEKEAEYADIYGEGGDEGGESSGNEEDDTEGGREAEAEDWKERLELHHKTGEVLPTAGNAELLLSHGPWRGTTIFGA
ncbi:hypothetical protein LJK87_49970 [Paenibacillus sp. P25]|nr:hypothetical protein LJK87_49970 [Paenibacillus sp. P25]